MKYDWSDALFDTFWETVTGFIDWAFPIFEKVSLVLGVILTPIMLIVMFVQHPILIPVFLVLALLTVFIVAKSIKQMKMMAQKEREFVRLGTVWVGNECYAYSIYDKQAGRVVTLDKDEVPPDDRDLVIQAIHEREAVLSNMPDSTPVKFE